MDILKILEESGKELYMEDLDFFETELATGDEYSHQYREKCRRKIREIRAWLNGPDKSHNEAPHTNEEQQTDTEKLPGIPEGLLVNLGDVAPESGNPAAAGIAPEQIIFNTIATYRKIDNYKSKFKQYVSMTREIDSAFVDENYSFFEPWELDAIISVKQMDESFLDKYFEVIDHDKIARYQEFSEGFFMKHWPELDPGIVLTQGKNDWRKKENRSKQLDVFLRLKGVQQ